MSCEEPHETDCGEILDHLYEYLDSEMPDGDRAKFQMHMDECSPCLEKYGLEQSVKKLVKRCCGQDDVPADLRAALTTEAGMNALITLDVDGDERLTIVKDMQRHPVKRNVLHVDFLAVDRNKPISSEVPQGASLDSMPEPLASAVSPASKNGLV
jgi:anti-sigma factor (TIGR02949 family)